MVADASCCGHIRAKKVQILIDVQKIYVSDGKCKKTH
jgi:hypothetical protein